MAIRKRLIGFFASATIRPRIKSSISAGATVIERSDAKSIENVFVNASGRKRRPSWASNVKTGRNETVMMSSE